VLRAMDVHRTPLPNRCQLCAKLMWPELRRIFFSDESPESIWYMSFDRRPGFIGRTDELKKTRRVDVTDRFGA
jgi:hypothetical protein